MNKTLETGLRLAVVVAMGVASTALAVDLTKLPPASTQTGVTYAKDIEPIFKASCFRCHGADRHSGNLRLDSLEATLKGGRDKVVTPGDSLKSELVLNVCWDCNPETPMPPKPRARRGGPPGGTNAMAGGTNAAPGGMRPGGPASANKPLTTEQVALIRAWVDQGAK